MSNCIFGAIVAGRAPANLVYHDDRCTAFLDIQPVNPGHLLIVPNDHAAYLADLDDETGGHLFRVAQRLAGALRRSGLTCEGEISSWRMARRRCKKSFMSICIAFRAMLVTASDSRSVPPIGANRTALP